MFMRTLAAISLGIVSMAISGNVSAQLPTTVQLPSFHSFSYRGTVVVPDGGTAYLGGNKTSATGLNQRGLSRGFGSGQGNSQATATVRIIDHGEIDRQLLGGTKEEFLRSGRGRVTTVDPNEEGKALVRYARKQYREGKRTASFDTYQMAIRILRPGLRELAKNEFKRVFGPAADQALRMSSLRR